MIPCGREDIAAGARARAWALSDGAGRGALSSDPQNKFELFSRQRWGEGLARTDRLEARGGEGASPAGEPRVRHKNGVGLCVRELSSALGRMSPSVTGTACRGGRSVR